MIQDKASLKWTGAKWETVLWSDESKCNLLFGKHEHNILQTEEERPSGLLSLLSSSL